MRVTTLFSRAQVAEQFNVAPRLLIQYEARGLIRASRQGELEGYDRYQVRRLWTIISLKRDLGINLAGVEAILRLRDHMDAVHQRLHGLASALRDALEDDVEPATND
jgi:MerR family transcriptional regulator, heat shock protein HspR